MGAPSNPWAPYLATRTHELQGSGDQGRASLPSQRPCPSLLQGGLPLPLPLTWSCQPGPHFLPNPSSQGQATLPVAATHQCHRGPRL